MRRLPPPSIRPRVGGARPFVVTSRCGRCGRYCNPRELDPATSRPGGGYKRDLHSTGVCRGCSQK